LLFLKCVVVVAIIIIFFWVGGDGFT